MFFCINEAVNFLPGASFPQHDHGSGRMSASLIGRCCQAPCVSGVYCQHCVGHASPRGRPCGLRRLPQALVGSGWRASLWGALYVAQQTFAASSRPSSTQADGSRREPVVRYRQIMMPPPVPDARRVCRRSTWRAGSRQACGRGRRLYLPAGPIVKAAFLNTRLHFGARRHRRGKFARRSL